MRRFRTSGILLLAMVVVGAAAQAAQAESAPFFTIGGSRLAAGRTHDIGGNGTTNFKLDISTAGVVIECTGLRGEAVLAGSNLGEPGKGNGIGEFTGCQLVEGNGAPECAVESTAIATNRLVGEEVANVVGSKGGSQLLGEFRPAKAAAGLATVKFSGTGCTVEETIVSGSTVVEVVTDNGAEEKIELGQTPREATSWKLRFPSSGKAITSVWLISNGVGKIQKTGADAFAAPAEVLGASLVLLANTKFEAESGKWSLLP